MIDKRLTLALMLGCALGAASDVGAQHVLEVTMRVLDDVGDLDAVVLVIGGDAAQRADAPTEVLESDAATARALVPQGEEEGKSPVEDRDAIAAPAPEVPTDGSQ